jgi:hypothetical protein
MDNKIGTWLTESDINLLMTALRHHSNDEEWEAEFKDAQKVLLDEFQTILDDHRNSVKEEQPLPKDEYIEKVNPYVEISNPKENSNVFLKIEFSSDKLIYQ